MIFLVSAVIPLGGCDVLDDMRTDHESVHVTLFNASGNNVHIITRGEHASPANRLAPGQSRSFEMLCIPTSANTVSISFVAIRNDEQLGGGTMCTVRATDGIYPDLTVTYTEEVYPEGIYSSLGCGTN